MSRLTALPRRSPGARQPLRAGDHRARPAHRRHLARDDAPLARRPSPTAAGCSASPRPSCTMAAMARSTCCCGGANCGSGAAARLLAARERRAGSGLAACHAMRTLWPVGCSRACWSWSRPAVCAAGGRADARSGQVAAAASLRPGRQDLDRARDARHRRRSRPRRSRARCGGGGGRDLLRGRPGGAEGAARRRSLRRCPHLPQRTGRSREPAVRRSARRPAGCACCCCWRRSSGSAMAASGFLAFDRGVARADLGLAAGHAGARGRRRRWPAWATALPWSLAFAAGQHRRVSGADPGRRACARWSWAICWPS